MSHVRLVGGTLLVSGTAIGAGMLALPVATGVAGFWPSVILFVVVWFFMTYTAFLMLEVNFAVQGTPNLISMARLTLGPIGEAIAWASYLLLLYALTAAYLSGCGALLMEALSDLFETQWPSWIGPIPFVVIFGGLVYAGIKPVDYINRLLMIGLGISFVILIVLISPRVEGVLITRTHFAYLIVPLSVVVTSFGFHIIIPSLTDYFFRDLAMMKKALLFGSLLPLILYIIWELLILGVVPLGGPSGLLDMLASGQPAAALTHSLIQRTNGAALATIIGLFAFLAIATSFLGVTLSLSDFIADGLRLHKFASGRIIAVLLALIPPLLFAWTYPSGFILALRYAGIFVAILLGILPALMAWSVRTRPHLTPPYRVWGGKGMLVVIVAVFVAVIVIHLCEDLLSDQLIEGVK